MKSKIITLLLSAILAVTVITGCGNSTTETSIATSTETSDDTSTEASANDQSADTTDASDTATTALPTSYEELIASLHAGQSYTYAPICEGENALLVTSYTFDDLEGHQATYEATIYMEKSGTIERVTTVQSSGTAYPIALSDDNSLIVSKRNSILKGYINKESGKFIITEESNVNYLEAENGLYHNYKDGVAEISTESSLYDELLEKYDNSEILNFQKAGVTSDGSPHLAGGVYAAYDGEDLYNIAGYYIFTSESSGSTETPDGISGIPFTYEVNADSITFHFASADDTSEAKFGWDNASFPTITFTGDNASGAEKLTLTCLNTADPASFEAAKYYNNDNNLYMQVDSFDENSLTGDLYREERIKQEYVDDAEEGSFIFSVNGTQFQVVSFEEVNKELEYATDEEFKKDVVGSTRFDGFLVKCSDDDFYYALEKEDYAQEYTVVSMMTEEILRKLIEENVTFKIKENCEITLLKFVENGESLKLENEYIIGREFKGDNYPGWSQDAKEFYMTESMLVAISVIDDELYNFVQIYIP